MTPLHHLGLALREWLSSVPLPAVRIVFVALPLVVLAWVLTLPRETTTPKHLSVGWTENLKLWAALALLVQIAIYVLV